MVNPRVQALVLALLLYAGFGSPTPDHFGVVEIVIGVLLVLSAGPLRLMTLFTRNPGYAWFVPGLFFLVYGLTIPLLIGVMAGNPPELVLRDLIPFLFLLMPIIFLDIDASARRVVTGCAAIIGVAFGARVFIAGAGDPAYLSIAPTVIFAAIFLVGMAGYTLYQSVTPRRVVWALVLAGMATMPLAAMAMTLQRASLGLFALCMAILLGVALWRRPGRGLWMVAGLVLAALVCGVVIESTVFDLLSKHHRVGSNMRYHEAAAVFDAVGASVPNGLFGLGWGATFESPAVGGLRVNFTHSLMTSLCLKAGVMGLGFGLIYLMALCAPLRHRIMTAPVVVLALAVPVMIDVVLYASYKSLDFGVILLLVALWTKPEHAGRPVATSRGMVYP